MTTQPSLIACRFGIGLPLVPGAADSPAAMLERLQAPDRVAERWPIAGMAVLFPLITALRRGKEPAKKDPALAAEMTTKMAELVEHGFIALRSTIARGLDAEDGFRERLVAFWADHFTVVTRGDEGRASPYALVEDAIRPNLTLPFDKMLAAVTMHPAMLTYLDQGLSFGPNSKLGLRQGRGLNENLARELLELHTLGVDAGYGQDDVRQMAELLTGLTYDGRRGFLFDARRAEPGPEVILGKSYDGKGDAPILAALGDIARRPETARHLAHKLAVHFLADTPDAATVDAMAQVWRDTGGDLLAVYGAMLNHPAAWVPAAEKVRQPWDFVLAAMKALGVTGADVMGWAPERLAHMVLAPLREMGQIWKEPRGPDGWPEEAEAWITPQSLAARINWAMTRPAKLVRPLPLPVDFARTALADRASEAVMWAAERAEDVGEGVGIVLSSPDFNRR